MTTTNMHRCELCIRWLRSNVTVVLILSQALHF